MGEKMLEGSKEKERERERRRFEIGEAEERFL